MQKLICAIIFYFLIANLIFGQTDTKPGKLKELAESAEINGDTYSAIYYYEQVQLQKPKIKTQAKLAQLYVETHDYGKAKNMLIAISQKVKNKSKTYLHLGICYKQLGKYDSCLYYLDQCNKNKLSTMDREMLKNEYKGAEWGLKTPADTAMVNIDPAALYINTNYMESAPCFINDSLIIYATQIINKDNLYNFNDTISVPQTKLFYAKKTSNNWIKTEELSQINTKFMEVNNGFFSLNNHLFYFTNTTKNWNNKNISEIYVCQHNNGNFSKPLKLDSGINDPYYTATQPTVGTTFNNDLEVVYFSSDRPGGKGGMDIWYTVFNKKRGTYGSPINAGARINTVKDEITPYYDVTTKTMYFSSNGHIGLGGYDVYKSIGELKSWTKAQNIGNYLNTHADEIYFRINPSRNAGFIVTNNPKLKPNQDSFCCFDLLYFTYRNPDQLKLKGTLLAKTNPVIDKLLKSGVEFRDSNLQRKNFLNEAVVSLYLKTELGADSLFITTDTTDINGVFEFAAGSDQDYSLIIQENDEIKANVQVSTKGTYNNENREIVLNIKPIESLPDVPLVIKNIYYGFGESELSDIAKKILDETLIKLMNEISNIKVEISSHTDDIGDAEYNLKLSEKRAENVAKYLTTKGIDNERLVAKGYGETDPIAPNKNFDGTDNPEGREKNRRTEFKIIGTFNATFGL